MPYGLCVPSLVLIAQVVFRLEHGHTKLHNHTTQASATIGVGNNIHEYPTSYV